MNDADRIFAAKCLLEKLLDENELIVALVMWRPSEARETSLADFAARWGLVRQALVDEFHAYLHHLAGDYLPERAKRLRAHAEEVSARALQQTSRPRLLEFFAGRSDGAATAHVVALVDFQLLRKAAQGGLGEVWLAHDENLNRNLAVKFLKEKLWDQPALRKRFEQEAQITGRLQHPNIIPIFQFGRRQAEDGGVPFYAMPFVEGNTLRELIASFHQERRRGAMDRLALIRLLDAFRSVCQAIAYAHSQGVLHRDLKPENVMVGKFGDVVVLDWGLAKDIRGDGGAAPTDVHPDSKPATENKAIAVARADPPAHVAAVNEDPETHPGTLVGTPVYMAPEQASGNTAAVNERTDIFGLGGILFYLLTDRPPHERRQGESVDEFLFRVATRPSRRACEVERRAAPMLDAICARAMAFEPHERYATASQLAADVERWIVGEPAAGIRESVALKCSRWIVRRQRGVISAGGATFVLLLLAAISWSHWSVSTKEVVEQQLHDSHYAVQVFAKKLLVAAEKLAGDVRFLGESRSAYGLLEARRSGNDSSIREAKRRFDDNLNRYASRRRTLRRAALIDFQGTPPERAALFETSDLGKPIVHQSSDEGLHAAERARGALEQLDDDSVILDKIYLVADSTRNPSQIWPRVRLIAPVFDDKKSLAGAIVIDTQFGIVDPKFAPKEEHENRERDTDWFMMDDAGTTLWSDPGRYFSEKDVPTGRPIVQVIPELAPMFQSGSSAPQELSIEQSGGSGVAVYAGSIFIPYFRPAPRLTIAASTPREPIIAASARRQSSMNNIAAAIASIAAAFALISGTVVMAVVRRSQRCFD